MALLDEQIDRLERVGNDLIKNMRDSLSAMFDEKISNLRELAKGLKVTNVTTIDTPDVQPAKPVI